MAHITFYEKPGCINNTKQKKWLEAAGHDVFAVNILEQTWTQDALKPFFGEKPIQKCFNMTAPVIKSGELKPEEYTEDAAYTAMIKDPILIKRPLMNIDDTHFLQGFDKEKIDQLIGLDALPGSEEVVSMLNKDDLTICPQIAKNTSCDEIAAAKNERSLGKLSQIVESMGLGVTYAYDDLIFIEHNAFLFQFPETPGANVYFNQDCPEAEQKEIFQKIETLARTHDLPVFFKGIYEMRQKGDEELEVEFIDAGEGQPENS